MRRPQRPKPLSQLLKELRHHLPELSRADDAIETIIDKLAMIAATQSMLENSRAELRAALLERLDGDLTTDESHQFSGWLHSVTLSPVIRGTVRLSEFRKLCQTPEVFDSLITVKMEEAAKKLGRAKLAGVTDYKPIGKWEVQARLNPSVA